MPVVARGYLPDAPPPARTRLQDHPTLLVSWWCIGMAVATILVRINGRMVRNNRLFREDKIMLCSLIPLLLRMAFVHPVLLYGTNNVQLGGLSETDMHYRSIGSRLVLPARVFFALYLWMAKWTTYEFLKRMAEGFWKRSWHLALRGIRWTLVATFLAVFIAILAECQPFDRYWQVAPDPGVKCRAAYAQLITLAVCSILTDVLLVFWPYPIILRTDLHWKRKTSLLLLFSLSVIPVAVTAVRVPAVIHRHGSQQYRTVFASFEIMAATAVVNCIVIGSFLRDRGVKKAKKYKFGSYADSMDRSSSARRPTKIFESDEDLRNDLFFRLQLEDEEAHMVPRPAPVAAPYAKRGSEDTDAKRSSAEDPVPSPRDIQVVPERGMSFFDVGGLLDSDPGSHPGPSRGHAADTPHSPASRRGSRFLLSDIGGFLSPSQALHGGWRPSRTSRSEEGHYELTPRSPQFQDKMHSAGAQTPILAQPDTLQSLQGVGGLLDNRESARTSLSSTLVPHSEASDAASRHNRYSNLSSSAGVGRLSRVQSVQVTGGLLKE